MSRLWVALPFVLPSVFSCFVPSPSCSRCGNSFHLQPIHTGDDKKKISILYPISRAALTTSSNDDPSLGPPSSPVNDSNKNNQKVEFPPPQSAIDRFKRAATFWSTALPIVADYYGLISRIKMVRPPSFLFCRRLILSLIIAPLPHRRKSCWQENL